MQNPFLKKEKEKKVIELNIEINRIELSLLLWENVHSCLFM